MFYIFFIILLKKKKKYIYIYIIIIIIIINIYKILILKILFYFILSYLFTIFFYFLFFIFFIIDLNVEGIYRKNGNIKQLKILSDAIDKTPGEINLKGNSPIQLAALMKKFLRDLPNPVLTFKLYPLFIISQSKFKIIKYIQK